MSVRELRADLALAFVALACGVASWFVPSMPGRIVLALLGIAFGSWVVVRVVLRRLRGAS